jgi:hypothetical protein
MKADQASLTRIAADAEKPSRGFLKPELSEKHSEWLRHLADTAGGMIVGPSSQLLADVERSIELAVRRRLSRD